MTAHPLDLSRRTLLAGGGALIVSFRFRPGCSRRSHQNLPCCRVTLKKAPFLDPLDRIDANGKITVFTGKSNSVRPIPKV